MRMSVEGAESEFGDLTTSHRSGVSAICDPNSERTTECMRTDSRGSYHRTDSRCSFHLSQSFTSSAAPSTTSATSSIGSGLVVDAAYSPASSGSQARDAMFNTGAVLDEHAMRPDIPLLPLSLAKPVTPTSSTGEADCDTATTIGAASEGQSVRSAASSAPASGMIKRLQSSHLDVPPSPRSFTTLSEHSSLYKDLERDHARVRLSVQSSLVELAEAAKSGDDESLRRCLATPPRLPSRQLSSLNSRHAMEELSGQDGGSTIESDEQSRMTLSLCAVKAKSRSSSTAW